MRPDKAKVVDEVWDDERIGSFLDKGPMGDEAAEFSVLLYAYRSMRVDDFGKFIELFVARGGDVNATNTQGQNLSQVIKNHTKAQEFLEVLSAHAS